MKASLGDSNEDGMLLLGGMGRALASMAGGAFRERGGGEATTKTPRALARAILSGGKAGPVTTRTERTVRPTRPSAA